MKDFEADKLEEQVLREERDRIRRELTAWALGRYDQEASWTGPKAVSRHSLEEEGRKPLLPLSPSSS